MKMLLPLLLAFFAIAAGHAQDAEPARENPAEAEEDIKIPSTLAEAHEELERLLPKDELAKIDAMKSEDEMSEYHFGAGMGMRNSWGLWGDSPLAKHMRSLGFTHADDMSSVILEAFWCKRHGKELRIKERAADYRAYWQEQKGPEVEVAPKGGGKINWIWRLEVPSRPHGVLHVGMDLKTRHFICYEHKKGIYYPDGPTLERIMAEIVQDPSMAGDNLGLGLREVKRSLSGVYKVISKEGDNGPLLGTKIDGHKLIISESLITTLDSEGNKVFEAIYQLNPLELPMAIEMISSFAHGSEKKHIELTGNIEKRGDPIRLIYALPGGDDPRDFKVGPKQELLVLSKVSELPVTAEQDLRTKQGEQGGADQPATAPKPQSEGKEKPKPESEVRPQ
jgi:hypothetical protein